jgi:hypothetical protein
MDDRSRPRVGKRAGILQYWRAMDAEAVFIVGTPVRLSPRGRERFARLASQRGMLVGLTPDGRLRIRRDGLPGIETWPPEFWEPEEAPVAATAGGDHRRPARRTASR